MTLSREDRLEVKAMEATAVATKVNRAVADTEAATVAIKEAMEHPALAVNVVVAMAAVLVATVVPRATGEATEADTEEDSKDNWVETMMRELCL